jgi:hypothetical protein
MTTTDQHVHYWGHAGRKLIHIACGASELSSKVTDAVRKVTCPECLAMLGATDVAETLDAATKIKNILDDVKLWEDLKVAALDLNDASDDFSEKLRKVEEVLRSMRTRPAWVALDKPNHALLWTGWCLEYDDGENPFHPLLGASRAKRVLAAQYLPSLLRSTRPV